MDNASKKRPELAECDVFLLIPGFYRNAEVPEEVHNALCDEFNSEITETIRAEYEEDCTGKFERVSLGELTLLIDEYEDRYTQEAAYTLMRHKETSFCVLEILIPDAAVGGNKILSHKEYHILTEDF